MEYLKQPWSQICPNWSPSMTLMNTSGIACTGKSHKYMNCLRCDALEKKRLHSGDTISNSFCRGGVWLLLSIYSYKVNISWNKVLSSSKRDYRSVNWFDCENNLTYKNCFCNKWILLVGLSQQDAKNGGASVSGLTYEFDFVQVLNWCIFQLP